MNLPLSNKLVMLLAAAFAVVALSTPALADDTEVYVGGNLTTTVHPNVLFIIDTSGSMGTVVNYDPYVPATTYAGSCVSGRIYWSKSGTAPDCSKTPDKDNYFDTAANKCHDSIDSLASTGTGMYLGKLAYYKPSTDPSTGADTSSWEPLSSSNHTASVECKADKGKYGDGNDTTKKYAANATKGGPWTADTSKDVSWNSTGDNYTLYTANYLNWFWTTPGGAGTETRLSSVKKSFAALVNSTSGINAGLMRFDSNAQGGYFMAPMQELNETNRPTLITAVNNLTDGGYTPLAETLYEASLYWRGATVDYGDSSSPGTNVSTVLNPSNTAKYKSPIEYQCQKNFTVYLTDGEPTQDTDADTKIKNLANFQSITGKTSCTGDCLDELALWMYKTDMSSTYNNTQNVELYTIYFGEDPTDPTLTDSQKTSALAAIDLLKNSAKNGSGGASDHYYVATEATGLANAFTTIVTNILATSTTFIAPAVTVNDFNRLTHRDELYFGVFKPQGRPNWPGNIKHYKISSPANIVVDANSAAAVDVNTGYFSGSSRSFWTLDADAPDGDEVAKGGAAGLITTTRNLYTYLDAAAPSNVNLADPANVFHEDNTALDATALNISALDADYTSPVTASTYRTSLLQWARGVDVLDQDGDTSKTDARRAIGDILHSKPILMTYGGTDANPDITLFTGSNDGFLHAFNAKTGAEQFAFIPKELLGNLNKLYINSESVTHPYGMDGPITLWHKDDNNNGLLLDSVNAVETGEHVYLYTGMRRGGNHYYALDVTNRSAPKLLWQINGGTGDFAELGQTWSRPTVAKIKLHNGTALQEHTVLIFAGGYDTHQDTAGPVSADSIGRAIYIVDAATGQRLWWASSVATANLVLPSMTNSIPADIKVIDMNLDGYADRLYVGDMGGRIWRFDLNNTTNTGAANFATGGIFASLSGVTEETNHRFYYSPDVALVKGATGYELTVSIGSGYRAHPLNTVTQDRFYMIRDFDVYSAPADANSDGKPDYPGYTEASLYDATANDIGTLTGAALATATSALNSAHGWYIRLVKTNGTYEGEKVLATSITAENKVLFTTFTPVASSQATACAPSQGTAKTYAVNLSNATAAYNLQADGIDYSTADRYQIMTRGGIPPEPTVLFPSDGSKPIVLVGPEKVGNVDLNLHMEKTYWRQDE